MGTLFYLSRKDTDKLKTCKKILKNLASNLITFWMYRKLELNWEALTELNENGEPIFYDSFIKQDAIFHLKCGKRFDNQKGERFMKLQENTKRPNSPVTHSSQPKQKIASIFCTICSEDDFDCNLHAVGLFIQLKQTSIEIAITN